jgi:hypothetical protein
MGGDLHGAMLAPSRTGGNLHHAAAGAIAALCIGG